LDAIEVVYYTLWFLLNHSLHYVSDIGFLGWRKDGFAWGKTIFSSPQTLWSCCQRQLFDIFKYYREK